MFKRNIILILVAMLVINTCGLHVSAMESDKNELSDYEEVINKVNTEYNRNFKITDTKAFHEYIVEKVSIEEFEQNLIKDAKDFSQIKSEDIAVNCNDNFTDIDLQPRISIVYERKHAFVTAPGKLGKVSATFEIVDLGTHRNFIRCTDFGHYTSDNGWYFLVNTYTGGAGVVSLTNNACAVRYPGCWVYGPTGLAETTFYKYTITYYI